ncbi:MAG: LuxR C-terminal-related transcriptional regulator, partial [Natronosporangium sp.]
VVQLVATGMTNRQIGQALSKAPGTIAQQLQSAMRKLGVSTRTAVAVAALRAAGSPADAGRSATVPEVD